MNPVEIRHIREKIGEVEDDTTRDALRLLLNLVIRHLDDNGEPESDK